ncbi:MAG: aminotransferase class I/II-fold pyridoxal phosphate-dependent enzyme, partial [Burkholderiales bacterium]|nr:aminotransferase class I/II-fold pyridoxal phosphate-dependent enzyme [Burkholderiales bacterium]
MPNATDRATHAVASGGQEAVDDLFETLLAQLVRDGLLRTRRVVQGPQQPLLHVDGRPMLSFASNDYLGLAAHPALVRAAIDAATHHGVGAGASALISGHHALHAALESELAQHVRRPRALHFGSGYLANIGTVPALVGPGDAVFSDQLNHACLIDGARLSRAAIHVYPHADVAALDAQLAASPA